MGQAAVDLPDPLQSPPTSAAGTDDLLAQLAGEEIERLLAEADADPAPTKPAAAARAPTAPAPTTSPAAEPAPAAADSKAAPPAIAEAPAEPAPQPTADAATPVAPPTAAADLDALFSQLDSAPAKPTGATPVSAGATEAPTATPPAAKAEEPSAAEALAQEMLEDAATAPGGHAPALEALPDSESEAENPDPLWLRILGWINAPMEACPDSVRDAVGKIAVLTTLNALAVLAYVVFFRRH